MARKSASRHKQENKLQNGNVNSSLELAGLRLLLPPDVLYTTYFVHVRFLYHQQLSNTSGSAKRLVHLLTSSWR